MASRCIPLKCSIPFRKFPLGRPGECSPSGFHDITPPLCAAGEFAAGVFAATAATASGDDDGAEGGGDATALADPSVGGGTFSSAGDPAAATSAPPEGRAAATARPLSPRVQRRLWGAAADALAVALAFGRFVVHSIPFRCIAWQIFQWHCH